MTHANVLLVGSIVCVVAAAACCRSRRRRAKHDLRTRWRTLEAAREAELVHQVSHEVSSRPSREDGDEVNLMGLGPTW